MERKDFDLPEPPPRRQLSDEEYAQRKFALYRNLFIFAALYATLHKIILPLMLTQTTVLVPEYTKVDFWAIPGLFLAFHLFRYQKVNAVASLLAGSLIAYAIWDTVAIFSGQHKGWLVLSHAISSIPIGLLSIILLSTQSKTRSLSAAWTGGAMAASYLLLMNLLGGSVLPEPMTVTSQTSLTAIVPSQCGAQEFEVKVRELSLTHTLHLADCGFSPSALLYKNGTQLVLERKSELPMNVHVLYFDAAGKRVRQSNRIIKGTENKSPLRELHFLAHEVAAILYSDTLPKIGKVLIVNEHAPSASIKAGVTEQRALVWSKEP